MITARDRYHLAFRGAVVCGLFAAVVAVMLLADYSRRTADDPLTTTQYAEMRQQLRLDPTNESLQQSFRQLDLELRESYFNSRRFAAWGSWLLLASASLAIGLGKGAAALRRRLPNPKLVANEVRTHSEEVDHRIGRYAVAAFGAAGFLVAIGFFVGIRSDLAPDVIEVTEVVSADSADQPKIDEELPDEPTLAKLPAGFPTEEELQANWPRFRGPHGLGIASDSEVLTQWDVETGEGILWKTEVPLAGNNSPTLWGDHVFMSGATEDKREVMCFNASSGELLWQSELPGTAESTAEVPKVMQATGLAAPTTATDGRRVYAIFANGDVGAFDFEGVLRWSRSLGIPKNTYGHASSLTTFEDLLIVQFDQGSESEKLSRLLALSTETGETVWETPRDEIPNSWPTPIVVQIGDAPQLLTCGSPFAIAYSPREGKEIWRADCLYGDVGPSPTYVDGIVITANEVPGVTAIKADGQGDVTETHLLWDGYIGVPDLCSPLATEQFVLLVTSDGLLTCYDIKEGLDPLWEHEMDASFSSSPTMIGNLVFLIDIDGKVFIVEPTAEACREVAENELGEACVTSPAIKDGKMYIRGETHLFCIGRQKETK
ncbi:outer membrane protein assembly factor BamB family protein [Novipirellula artificiosorum]|uniref:Outer membrane biogenesis protein BamB n=1 Tax=Novipirellula artificiosorum TaxID=2528016 RepID=A0A5C6E0N8_9BACT|nr:PQQ-binding-like beta-propeller repeat protein [Novipirellula artificiosorum]TWU42420.1 outer membrane biogenesis protein BamB [Novipirellula artificiosorum]